MTFFSLLLSALLPLVAAALAKDICLNNPTIYRFSHGEIRGTIVSDGPLIMTDSPFAVPDEAVRRSYRTAFRKTTPFVLSQNVAVLDVPRVGRVLVDSGSLNTQALVDFTEKAGRLSENLDAAGISKHSIDYIFITHGHIDHVAGIRDTDGSPTFPNATLVIGKMEHEYWSNPTPNVNNLLPNELLAPLSVFYKQTVAPYESRPGRLMLVPDNGRPFPGVRFLLGPGHSPGHNAIEFTSAGNRLVFSGDTWITRPDQLQNPEWGFSSESDTFDAFSSRIKLLSRLARRRDLVVSYHEHFPGLGFISQAGHLFDWVPIAPQHLEIGVSTQC